MPVLHRSLHVYRVRSLLFFHRYYLPEEAGINKLNDNSHGKICQLANFSMVFRTGSYEKHNGTGEFQNIG